MRTPAAIAFLKSLEVLACHSWHVYVYKCYVKALIQVKDYVFVCSRVCMCACVHVCVCARADCVCVRMCENVHAYGVCVCVLSMCVYVCVDIEKAWNMLCCVESNNMFVKHRNLLVYERFRFCQPNQELNIQDQVCQVE